MVATGLLVFVIVGFGLLISLGGLLAAAVLLLRDNHDRGMAIAVLAISSLCFLATLATMAGLIIYSFF